MNTRTSASEAASQSPSASMSNPSTILSATADNDGKRLPTTMKAATLIKYNAPLEILDDVPVPTPTGSDLLVKIGACSLCMSDIAGFVGALPYPPPYCAGHEPAGVVVAVPEKISTGFEIGDRVGFMPASSTCQTCYSCLSGNHRMCKAKVPVGFTGSYGGFSEYSLADPLSTVKIPAELSDDEAAPLLCAGVTAYAAVKKIASKQTGGTLINIVGCGGVGHLAVQYAKKMGFDVQAFDITADKLELALACGADTALDSSDPKTATSAPQAQSTIVVSGAARAYAFAFQVTQDHGRVIAIGVPAANIELSVLDMVLRDISLIPTNQGTKLELDEALQLAAAKGIKPKFERRHMSQINEGVEDMKQGKISGRLVYHY